jgi:transposase-like protein
MSLIQTRDLCDLGSHKYLNNINMVEQGHRDVKGVTHPMLGFKAFEAAQPTLVGIARMPMLQKRPWEGRAEQGLPAAEPFYALAASSCSR